MVKTLAKYIGEYKKSAIITPFMMIIEVVCEMIIPLLIASIIDDGVMAGDMHHIMVIGGCMLLVAVVGLIGGILGGTFGWKAATGFGKNLRQGMFYNIQTFSFANIDRFSMPSLVTRMTTDVTNVQNAFQMIIRIAVRAPVSMITAMVLAAIVNLRLSAIFFIAVVILGIIISFIVKFGTKHFRQAFPKYDNLNESVQENVSGIRVVKAYVREEYETKKFNTASRNIYKIFTKAEAIVAANNPVMNATIYICILLISWFGANMIVVGDLTTGELMSLLTYCLNILTSLMMVSMVFVMITMSEASAERICEVLNENSLLTNPDNPVMTVEDGGIEFKDVNFKYNPTSEENILSDINLKIPSGSVIGIMGGTGSGKTSLINLISRLYDVSAGEVTVGGVDVRKYDLEVLRDNVAVVLQKNELFTGTVLENLRWGNENATLEQAEEVCRIACADEFIEKMPQKYNTRIEQGGKNVSGGQKQRLCIARALLKSPKVLILDDSTSAVDTATDAKIRQAFRDFLPGVTKLIIAQRLSSIEDADRIIVMDKGRIGAFDTHENLLETNEIYKEVWESQVNGSGDFDKIGGEG